MRLRLLTLILAMTASFAVSDGYTPAQATPGQTMRVSVPNLADEGTLGTQANSYSGLPDISADGRFVAFESNASNLVLGDWNGLDDIFVHDRATGATERVNVSSGGDQANGDTLGARISGDGRYVAFSSSAPNLVAGDSNSSWDVFIRDRQTGVTERVSVDGGSGQGDRDSVLTDMTPDGRFVVFSSWASNMVPGDTNQCEVYFEFEVIIVNCQDVFIKDRLTGVTERVSVNSAEQQGTNGSSGGSVSDDARFIVFYGGRGIAPGGGSGTVIRDRILGTTEGMAAADAPEISGDGNSIVFQTTAALVPDDTNVCPYLPCYDSYVYSRASAGYERVSVDSSGSQGDNETRSSDISGNGRFVAFMSKSSNLIPGDTNVREDIFLRDRAVGLTRRVNLDSSGAQANDVTWQPDISDDGRFVAFTSWASNLIASDTNGTRDVFVHEVSFPDTDGDGVTDEADNCPLIGNASQTDSDGDGVGTACDNCPDTANPTQTNTDGDSMGNACDSDDDNDGVNDVVESRCGSESLDVGSHPERVDLPGDDDGDGLADEALPSGAEGFDCDGDGYTGTVEAHVFGDTNVRDLVSGGIPDSTDRITDTDLTSFLAPIRRLNTSPGDEPAFDIRWDVTPGAGTFANVININDLTSLIIVAPPMLGNVRAFGGPACPWP